VPSRKSRVSESPPKELTNGQKSQEYEQLLQTQESVFSEQLATKDQEMSALVTRNLALQDVVKTLSATNTQLITISSQAIDEREQQLEECCQKLAEMERERDNALKDISGVEASFAELHGRYEKLKSALESARVTEEQLVREFEIKQSELGQQRLMYDTLKMKAEEAIASVSNDREQIQQEREKEFNQLRVQVKRAEMKANSLQSQLDQKSQENHELAQMLDEFTAGH